MKWITRERAKVDRIACPWLIKRFIDSSAEILYVAPKDVLAIATKEGATPFDVPGVELTHAGPLCSFDAFLVKYHLEDPALAELAEMVRAADTDTLDRSPQAPGLLSYHPWLGCECPRRPGAPAHRADRLRRPLYLVSLIERRASRLVSRSATEGDEHVIRLSRRKFMQASAAASLVAANGIPITLDAAEERKVNAPANAFDYQHAVVPLPFDAKSLKGLSDRLIQSHWENNYGGAVAHAGRHDATAGGPRDGFADWNRRGIRIRGCNQPGVQAPVRNATHDVAQTGSLKTPISVARFRPWPPTTHL